jgi:putative acetyltransferase
MNIFPVGKKDYPEVISVWEASVRATHDFLSEDDIQILKPLIQNEYLQAVALACMKDDQGKIMGFIGVADEKIEMLFIEPQYRGKSIGKKLLQYAIASMHAFKVDVNEQNEQAVGFYKHAGFEVVGRSPLDGQGKPFPLLHLSLPLRA